MPRARVKHFVTSQRLNRAFVWKRFHQSGRTKVRLGELATCKMILGMPRWALRQYLENLVLSQILFPLKNERWLRALKRAAVCRGILEEAHVQRISLQRERSRSLRCDETVVCR